MNRHNSRQAGQNRGVLDQLESVKDMLHAVDDDIEGLLTRPTSTPPDTNIPTLNDVVAEPQQAAHEPSADHELSRTNKYRALTDQDLQAATTAQPQVPHPQLNIDSLQSEPECASEDDMGEIEFESQDTPSEAPTASQDEIPENADNYIVPDIELLDAELGVDPLPAADGANISVDASIEADFDFLLDDDMTLDADSIEQEQRESADDEVGDIEAELANFSISTSSNIDVPAADQLAGIPIEPAITPPPQSPVLTQQELTQLIEDVLDSHMIALQDALMEKLAPFVARKSIGEPD